MYILTRFLQCLASNTERARCRLVDTVGRAIDSATVAALWVVKKTTSPRSLPLPPTKTYPIDLPPTQTFVIDHGYPWTLWAILIPLLLVAVIVIVAIAAKMGTINAGRRRLSIALGPLRASSFRQADPYQVLPNTDFLAHADLPFYDPLKMLQTALPAPYVFIDPDPNRRSEFWGSRTWERIGALDLFFSNGMINPLELRKVGVLGAGGFGTVLKVRIVGTEAREMAGGSRFLAVKRLPRPMNTERSRWAAIISEVETHWLTEDNPAFPKLYGAFQNRKHCFLVMECGAKSFGTFSPADHSSVLFYGRQLADAVRDLHQTGVVHFDLKPDNLILDADGNLQVIDYGLVCLFEQELPDSVEWPEWTALRDTEPRTDAFPMLWPDDQNPHTTTAAGGTPGYISPAAEMGQACSYGADLWAFGVILFEWLTHEDPTFDDGVWQDNAGSKLSVAEADFFQKIFSEESPARFESWFEVNAHPLWKTEGEGECQCEEDGHDTVS
ncbi:kinase-like domain-containing protein [Mycena filopes]|nr:kinase-like domain-containing protein [Mycena filopes]